MDMRRFFSDVELSVLTLQIASKSYGCSIRRSYYSPRPGKVEPTSARAQLHWRVRHAWIALIKFRWTPSQADAEVFKAVGKLPDEKKNAHVARWFKHIQSYSEQERAAYALSFRF